MDLLLGAGQGGELGVNPVGAGVTHPHLPPVCVCVSLEGNAPAAALMLNSREWPELRFLWEVQELLLTPLAVL